MAADFCKRVTRLAAAAFALAFGLGTVALAESKSLNQEIPIGEVNSLSLDFPVGKLQITGGDANSASVAMEINCKGSAADCRRILGKVTIVTRTSSRELEVKIKGLRESQRNDLDVRATVVIPKALAFALDMGVGELSITGLEGALEVDLGVGDAEVRLARDRIRSVELDAGVGSVTLQLPEGEIDGKGFLGQGLRWTSGAGSAPVEIDVGVGEIRMVLE